MIPALLLKYTYYSFTSKYYCNIFIFAVSTKTRKHVF